MYISESQIRSALTYESLIPVIRQALIDYSAGRVEQPPRTVLRAKDQNGNPSGWFAVMPVIYGNMMAVKTVTFYPGNNTLPTHMAMIELLDRATGQPLAVMDGRLITEMRTAAVSAVAVKAIAPEAKTLGILGSGVQAHAHIDALRLIQPTFRAPGNIKVWSRNSESANALAQIWGATSEPIEAVAAADVVVTVTSATEPILKGKWLAPESLVVAVGAVGPQLRELDDEVMQGCLIAESRQGAENESGDVLLSGARVYAEIGEILSWEGRAGVAALPSGRRVFKSLGMAIEDLTGAALAWSVIRG